MYSPACDDGRPAARHATRLKPRVGQRQTDGASTQAAHWNGTAWSIVPTPDITRDGDANMLTGVSADGADDVWARAMPTTTGRTCGCPMSCTGTATAGDQQRRPASVGVEGPNTTVGLVHRRFHDLVVNRSKGESGQHVPGVGSASSCMPAGVGLGRRCPARWQGDRCPTIVGISPPLKADGTAGRAAEEGELRRVSWGV